MSDKGTSFLAELIGRILKDNEDLIDFEQIRMGILRFSDEHPLVVNIDINDDLSVSHKLVDSRDSFEAFSIVFEVLKNYLEIFSEAGEAAERIRRTVEPFVFENKELIMELGIDRYVSRGISDILKPKDAEETAESGKREEPAETGIKTLDDMLRGGLPRRSAVLLQGPIGAEADLIAANFALKGLTKGEDVLVFLCLQSPEEFKDTLERLLRGAGKEGPDNGVEEYLEKGLLKIVDWYTYNLRRVHDVEEEGGIIRSSRDLTTAGIAFDMALKSFPGGQSGEQRGKQGDEQRNGRRAIIDVTSPVFKTFGTDMAYDYIQALKVKLRNYGFTSIFTANKNMHRTETLHLLNESFDGVLDIAESREGNTLVRELRVISMRDVFPDYGTKRLELSKHGLVFLDSSGEESEDGKLEVDLDAEAVPFGIKGFEILAGSKGIPEGACLALQGSYGVEKERVASMFIKEGISRGDSILLTLATVSPADFHKEIAVVKANSRSYQEKGFLGIVDWFSYKDERIIGIVEEDVVESGGRGKAHRRSGRSKSRGAVIKSSQDLSNLGVAVKTQMARLPDTAHKRAVIDLISPALKIFDFTTVYEFVQTLRARLKERGFTVLFIMEREMHDAETLNSFYSLFDGVITVEKFRELESITMKMGVFGFRRLCLKNHYKALRLWNNIPIIEDVKDDGRADAGVFAKADALAAGPGYEDRTLFGPAESIADLEAKGEAISADIENHIRELKQEIKRLNSEKQELQVKAWRVLERERSLEKKQSELEKQLGESKSQIESLKGEKQEIQMRAWTVLEKERKLVEKEKEFEKTAKSHEEEKNILLSERDELIDKVKEFMEMERAMVEKEESLRARADAIAQEINRINRKKKMLEDKEKSLKEKEAVVDEQLMGAEKGVMSYVLTREETRRILKVLDDMMENLPDDILENFARSKDFKLYERLLELFEVE